MLAHIFNSKTLNIFFEERDIEKLRSINLEGKTLIMPNRHICNLKVKLADNYPKPILYKLYDIFSLNLIIPQNIFEEFEKSENGLFKLNYYNPKNGEDFIKNELRLLNDKPYPSPFDLLYDEVRNNLQNR